MKFAHVVLVLLFAFHGSMATAAKEFPVQARLFAGAIRVDPKELNTELDLQDLKKVDSVMRAGVEITYPLLKFFDVGLSYIKHNISRDERTSSWLTDYKATIDQDSALLIGRIPFLKSKFVRMDVYAGIGGSNTTLTMKTATQDGELSRKDTKGWFASPFASYGGSVALGYKYFYLVFEGGVETNRPTGFDAKGTINNRVEMIDLSGSYFSVGLLFDGIPATQK